MDYAGGGCVCVCRAALCLVESGEKTGKDRSARFAKVFIFQTIGQVMQETCIKEIGQESLTL